jgi:predicted phosphodiesterase
MMRRTTKATRGPASAILTADLHLEESTPVSRTDDYRAAQLRKLEFLQTLRDQNGGCPILCAGDIFNKWKVSPWLAAWAYSHLPEEIITVPGNHELPMHSVEEFEKSILHLMEMVRDDFKVLQDQAILVNDLSILGIPFGQFNTFDPGYFKIPEGKRYILLLHELTWEGKKPMWAGGYSAQDILDKFGEYFDLIVVGDNHESFVVEGESCLLVNPGSMMRIRADQADFHPRCFLYYAETNKVIPVEFPIDEGVHNREHLDRKKEHDERIAAYIERMRSNWKGGLSFKENLQAFFDTNDTPKKVRNLIWLHLEEEEI